jgi:hypothetical protein
MPKGRQPNTPCRLYSEFQARAGLIPASDDIADERRARMNQTARIIRTVKASSGTVSRVSDDRAITDILTDLRHYCDSMELEFGKLDGAAYAQYLEESVGAAQSGGLLSLPRR